MVAWLAALILQGGIPQYPGYKLVWQDEFNVAGPPNAKDWNYETGFVRNRELQLYRKENVACSGGLLRITGKKERVGNPAYDASAPSSDWRRSRKCADYTSGSIKTAGKRTWTYGRLECYGRFGITEGLWPAFWLTGPTREWPANGEIDVMEFYQSTYLANAAWGSARPGASIWKSSKTPISDIAKAAGFADPQQWAEAFHLYRMDWDPDWIRLYVDGRLLNEIDLSKTVNESPDGKNPFHEPHHIILNLAIGATGGDPSKTRWPSVFEVDWVRVYQKSEPAAP